MSTALYASNVFHYDHVLSAMAETFDDVRLAKRLEFSQSDIDILKRIHAPEKLTEFISRRMREPTTTPVKVSGLGVFQILTPIATRLGISLSPGIKRSLISNAAKAVSIAARDADVLHFVEGLGHHALNLKRQRLSICEVRNFHYRVFREPVELLAGFPLNSRPEAIAEILDYEYDNSDAILVYSEAVRQSFISRGHDPSKVLVAPIGIGPQLSRISCRRDEHTLIFVGRGDPSKGLDVAVATLQVLGSPFKLQVAGPMSSEVRDWLQRQSRVEYLGILSRSKLRDLYSKSGAMILPSVESFGIAAAEAVYHGLPLICSDLTGISDYLPVTLRRVVKGRDPENWAQAVLSAILEYQAGEYVDVDAAFSRLTWHEASLGISALYRSLCNKYEIDTK